MLYRCLTEKEVQKALKKYYSRPAINALYWYYVQQPKDQELNFHDVLMNWMEYQSLKEMNGDLGTDFKDCTEIKKAMPEIRAVITFGEQKGFLVQW